MSGVLVYEKASREFGLNLSARGHHVVYRANESNRCPGCGHANWHVGRMTAECAFCGTAVPLAEADWSGSGSAAAASVREDVKSGRTHDGVAERRAHERLNAHGRVLQLLIDGCPHKFALHNISAGGLMGENPAAIQRFARVYVRFEGGIIVPAEVRWCEGPLLGLAFQAPVSLDGSPG